MSRWYDHDPEFSSCVEKLRDAKSKIRDTWVKEILAILNDNEPESLNTEKLIDFPLNMFRRRWYDADPYLWIIMNTLQNAKAPTKEAVKNF